MLQLFLRWLQRTFRRSSPLAEIALLPIGTTPDDAIALYGDPDEAYVDDVMPEAIGFCFREGQVPKIVAWLWNDEIHAVVYYSDSSNPGGDLKAMFDAYAEGHKWNVWNPGYLYNRADNKLRLTCSVMPIYAVGTPEYFAEKGRRKRAAADKEEASEE